MPPDRPRRSTRLVTPLVKSEPSHTSTKSESVPPSPSRSESLSPAPSSLSSSSSPAHNDGDYKPDLAGADRHRQGGNDTRLAQKRAESAIYRRSDAGKANRERARINIWMKKELRDAELDLKAAVRSDEGLQVREAKRAVEKLKAQLAEFERQKLERKRVTAIAASRANQAKRTGLFKTDADVRRDRRAAIDEYFKKNGGN